MGFVGGFLHEILLLAAATPPKPLCEHKATRGCGIGGFSVILNNDEQRPAATTPNHSKPR